MGGGGCSGCGGRWWWLFRMCRVDGGGCSECGGVVALDEGCECSCSGCGGWWSFLWTCEVVVVALDVGQM